MKVNSHEVEMNEFVNSFVTNVVLGAVNSLKGVSDISTVIVNIENREVYINVNDKEVPLTPFPEQFILNTLIGLVSSLKGVTDVKSVEIRLNKA